MGQGLSVLFLGTASCTPERGENTASFLVDRRIVVDCGWYLTDRLLAAGVDPLTVEAVLLTHCHHDHILGLPQLLFYYGISWDRRPKRPLHVYGPAGEIGRVVDDARRFLQFDRYQELVFDLEVHEVAAGDALSLAGLRVTACAARHSVPGLCCRFGHPSGASVTLSGDTAYNRELVALARGTSLLVHEASYGPEPKGDDPRWGHSGAPDAAEVARQARAGRLALVHCGRPARQEALAAARAVFPNTFLPADGQELFVQP